MARTPGTAEETGTFLRSPESLAQRGRPEVMNLRLFFTDLFVKDLLNFSEKSGECEQIRIIKTQLCVSVM